MPSVAVVEIVVVVDVVVAVVVVAVSHLRPVWITFLRYNFSVVAIFTVIYLQ